MPLMADIGNFLANQLDTGIGGGLLGRSDLQSSIDMPWQIDNDAFFPEYEIDPYRWNKMFPYRLLVVDISKGAPKIVGGNDITKTKSTINKQPNASGGLDYVLTEEVFPGGWIYNLPITPQQLQILDQYSVNVTATMRGIVEEHNGIKFKILSVSGTTGIWPRRPTVGASLRTPGTLASIFSGTINGINAVASSFGNVAKAFSGATTSGSAGQAVTPEDSEAGEFSTGYYQALYLGQFLERYVMAKKKPENKHWRLVFDIPKQNQAFVVTPIQFSLNQSQQRPNEMLFSFQLKAWKRIDLKQAAVKVPADAQLPKLDANLFQKINNSIRAVRSSVATTTNLIKAVRSDIQNVFNVFRQISLAVKDIGGLTTTVMDFPGSIIQDFKSMVINEWKTIPDAFQRPNNSSTNSTVTPSPILPNSSSASAKNGAVISYIMTKDKANEGLTTDAVSSGALGNNAIQSQEVDPIGQVFNNPEEYFDLFDAINIESLPLNEKQLNAIDDEVQKIRLLTVNDFRNFKQELLNLALDISNNFGAGNSVYASLYGRATPKVRATSLTVEETEVLENLFEAIQNLDYLTSTKVWDDLHKTNSLQFVGTLANESQIAFEVPQSKMLVPVPFGFTIEQIATRYLNNPDRWIEIATLNNLRSPYIDETGFIYILLSNGNGRQFNVDDSLSNLYIGQQIILKSNIVPAFTRNIVDIKKISDTNYLINVDGEANLDSLTTTDSANIQGYQGGTVNSQNQIFIPINAAPQVDDRSFDIPNLTGSKELTAISKIDFLLTSEFDVALNSLGDFRLANSINNLVQCLMLKIRTKKGTLLRHLEYGMGLKHGMSVADLQNGEIINSLNTMIKDDPKFEKIDRLEMTLSGPTLIIKMSVILTNNNGVLPITFDIKL